MNEEEIVKLKEENEQLKAKLARAENEVRVLRRRLGLTNFPFSASDFYFESRNHKPKLVIKRGSTAVFVHFESINDKTAILAQALCEDSSRIQKMLTEGVSLDDLYEWLERGDWFDTTKKERKQFKNDVYQWFRMLNDKIAKELNGKKIFKPADGGYIISPFS